MQSPEHLGIYLQGSAPERVVEQVTCGDVGIEKAVIVPKSLYSLMFNRLQEFTQSKDYKHAILSTWGARRDLQGFLARRCTKEFLSFYIERRPALLDEVAAPGLFLDTVPEVQLAERLHELGLLPEDKRRQFIKTVSNYAIDGEDMFALRDEDIRAVFTEEEFADLVERARTRLLPRLGDVRREWESNHPSDDSPESYMQPLLDGLDALKDRFSDDNDAVKQIERQISLTNEWIAEHQPDEPERSPRKLEDVETQEKHQSARSIFDDIDADGDSSEA